MAEREAVASAALPLLKTNVTYDRAATDAAREAAAQTVQSTVVVLKRNQTIARAGDTVTPQMLAQFAAIARLQPHRAPPAALRRPLPPRLRALLRRLALHRIPQHDHALPLSHARAFTLVGLSVLVQLVLMRVGFFVAESIASQSGSAPMNDVTIWSFAIPFAAAALLVAMLVDTQLALITAVLSAIFAGLLAPGGMLITCFALVSSSAAIYGFGRYSDRQSVMQAGLVVGTRQRRSSRSPSCSRRSSP